MFTKDARTPRMTTMLTLLREKCKIILFLFAMLTPGRGFTTTSVPLGMEDETILDSQLSASTFTVNHDATKSRLRSSGPETAWCAGNLDDSQWLEIQFHELVTVTGISTQGREEADEWTETYRLSYKTYEYWQFYTDDGGDHEVFTGNTDRDTVVPNSLPRAVEAEAIRIHPLGYIGGMCLRVEVIGYRMGPPKAVILPLGITSGAILDAQLTASSVLNDGITYEAFKSRIGTTHGTSAQGWCGIELAGEWIQADLLVPVWVTSIRIKMGKTNDNTNSFIRSFYVLHSNDGTHFENALSARNNNENFDGVTGTLLSDVTRDLLEPVFARYIRVEAYTSDHQCCTLWEINGYSVPDIGEALGMENNIITDSQVTASSQSATSAPERGRLNYMNGDGMSAWCAQTNDANQWLQVDFGAPSRVTGVTVQGRGDTSSDEFVTSFSITYSHDGINWSPYLTDTGQQKVFPGSYDKDTPVTNPLLHNYLAAQYTRLHPVTWQTAICMRIELLGYSNPDVTTPRYDDFGVNANDMTIPTSSISASSEYDGTQIADSGRLFDDVSAWRPANNDMTPWLRVNLGTTAMVTGLITQGHPVVSSWVSAYQLTYSEDEVEWFSYTANISSNYDKNTALVAMLISPVRSQYVQVNVVNSQTAATLRLEILGYPAAPLYSTTVPTPELTSNDRIQIIQQATQISPIYGSVMYNNDVLDVINDEALYKIKEIIQDKETWTLLELQEVIAILGVCADTQDVDNFFSISDSVLGLDLSKVTDSQTMINEMHSNIMKGMEGFAESIATNMIGNEVTMDGVNIDIRITTLSPDDVDPSLNLLTVYDQTEDNSITIHLTDTSTAQIGNEDVKLSVIVYKNMHNIIGGKMEGGQAEVDAAIETSVVSNVVSYIIVGGGVDVASYVNEENPMYLNFVNAQEPPDEHVDICVYWEFHESLPGGIWSTDGCELYSSTSLDTTCRCSHLTNFAVLMQTTTDRAISDSHSLALELITYIGTISSIISLLFSILVYAYLRLLKNQRIILHANLALSLAIAQLIYISGIGATFNQGLCTSIAVVLHYFFLVSFMWMLLEGVQLYTKSVHVFGQGIRTWVFMLLGWGIPVIIVGISFPIRPEEYGTEDRCWLSTEKGLIWAFVVPVLVVIAVNIFVLIMVIRVFMTLKANADKTEKERMKAGMRAILMLQPLLGLTWFFGFISSYDPSLLFNYLFVIFNSLQGVFIFVLHCLLNDEVRKTFRIHQKKMKSSVMSSSGTESSVISKTKIKSDYKSDLTKINVEEKKKAPNGKEVW